MKLKASIIKHLLTSEVCHNEILTEKTVCCSSEQIDLPQDEPAKEPPLASQTGTSSSSASSDNLPKPFSYRELKKVSKDIVLFTSENINSLYKEQGVKDFPRIKEAKFIEFSFCPSGLIGKFKISYLSTNIEESTIYVNWNGNKATVW